MKYPPPPINQDKEFEEGSFIMVEEKLEIYQYIQNQSILTLLGSIFV